MLDIIYYSIIIWQVLSFKWLELSWVVTRYSAFCHIGKPIRLWVGFKIYRFILFMNWKCFHRISEVTLQCFHFLNIGGFVWKLFKSDKCVADTVWWVFLFREIRMLYQLCIAIGSDHPEEISRLGHVAMKYG